MHQQAALRELLVPAIRFGRAAEGPELMQLVNRAFQVEELYVPGPRIDCADLDEHMESGRFLVADGAASPVGTVFVDTHGQTGRIELLAVDPGQQGRGIGRRLLDVAEALCRAEACRRVELKVLNLRRPAIRFYQRAGYVLSRTAPFNGDAHLPCHFEVMSKELVVDEDSEL